MTDVEQSLLIAEMDENRAVAWVWLYAPGSRGPRPAREGMPCEIDPRRARVHGADRQAVMAWLQAQGCLSWSDAGEQSISDRTGRPTRRDDAQAS